MTFKGTVKIEQEEEWFVATCLENMETKDFINIYEKEKNILESLYDYYCKFQKIYFDLSFSQILNPVDTATIKNIDIKDFVNQIKSLHKQDYEVTISSLKEDDICHIKKSYEQLENDVDKLASTLINIQSVIVSDDYKNIEDNYLKFLDEYNTSKEIFK